MEVMGGEEDPKRTLAASALMAAANALGWALRRVPRGRP